MLGCFYFKGQNVEKNYIKAFNYFKQSSKLGNSNALIAIGHYYEKGIYVKQDYFKAKEYYKKSSELDNSKDYVYLGQLYEEGFREAKDYLKAKYYYEKSSKLNNSEAFISLGKLYEKGLGVEQNYLLAKECYEKSLELNNPDALILLGKLYEKGLGVEQNYLLAKECYEKSSLFDNAVAFNCLGNLYEKGLGVEQNYLLAKDCYQIASNHNDPFAHFYLGNFYSNDELDEFDIQKSIEYYLKSIQIPNGKYIIIEADISIQSFSENNYRYASCNNLGLIYITCSKSIDINKAKKYLKESSNEEYPFGQNSFGLFSQFYLNDINMAISMYEKILKQNKFSLAYYNLGKINENNNDNDKSIQFYIEASKYENEPLIFRGFEYNDKRFEISKKFIVCLTNLKIVNYYLKKKLYDISKEYFIKLIFGLNIKDKNCVYKFHFRMKSEDETVEDYLSNFFNYLKMFILNFPLFNLRNQPNIDSNIFNDYKNQIENDLDVDKSDSDDSEESENEETNKIHFDDISKINFQFKFKNNKCKMPYNFSIQPNKKHKKEPNKNKSHPKSFYKDPSEFFEILIENIKMNSNIREIIINRIDEIIKIMNRILYEPPYLILFGRISLQKPKSDKNVETNEINLNFYDGFGIDFLY